MCLFCEWIQTPIDHPTTFPSTFPPPHLSSSPLLPPPSQLDETVSRSLKLKMMTGIFDPLDDQPYTTIGIDALGSNDHHTLAYDVAAQGIVLLQNPLRHDGDEDETKGGNTAAGRAMTGTTAAAVLPLDLPSSSPASQSSKWSSKTITTAVIGPHANSTRKLLGSYFDQACPPTPGLAPSDPNYQRWDCIETPLHAITALLDRTAAAAARQQKSTSLSASPSSSSSSSPASASSVVYAPGCDRIECDNASSLIPEAAAVAAKADQVILLMGLYEHLEGEGNDRTNTTLPGAQQQLIDAVVAAVAPGTPVVVVLVNGGILSVDNLVSQTGEMGETEGATTAVVGGKEVALVEAWYPGVRGAAALADAIFGVTNRFGKLPVTVYRDSFSAQVRRNDSGVV